MRQMIQRQKNKKRRAPLLMLLILSTLIAELLGFGIQVTAVEKKNPAIATKEDQKTNAKEEMKKVPRKMYLVDLIDALQRHSKEDESLKSAQIGTNSKKINQKINENKIGIGKKEVETTLDTSNEIVLDANSAAKNQNSTQKEFTQVDTTYFDDALFIGDSRTVGLSQYSGWSNATFYANIGMTIYDLFDKNFISLGGNKVNLTQALQQKQFKKIYLMVGINELGRGTPEQFLQKYTQAVQTIHTLEPNAIIFVEGIMYVTKEKSDKDPIFNNQNIRKRNTDIKTLADNKTIFYIDVNEAVSDGAGNLIPEYSFDQIHLKAKYYKLWTDFLQKHGIVIK